LPPIDLLLRAGMNCRFISPQDFFFKTVRIGSSEREEKEGEAFPEKTKKILGKTAAMRNPVESSFQLPYSHFCSLLQAHLSPGKDVPYTQGAAAMTRPLDGWTPLTSYLLPSPNAFPGYLTGRPCVRGFSYVPAVQGPWTQKHPEVIGQRAASGTSLTCSKVHPERFSKGPQQPQAHHKQMVTPGHHCVHLENMESKDSYQGTLSVAGHCL
jgi:hypothetical protein